MAEKILVVDDDPGVVKIIESFLSSEGYQLDSADNGLDGLLKIKDDVPDLVILDVMLPEVNGYDICYQLRFNEDFEKVPIILMTSRDKELGDKVSKRVDIEYVHKPIDKDLLLKKVKKLITSRQ